MSNIDFAKLFKGAGSAVLTAALTVMVTSGLLTEPNLGLHKTSSQPAVIAQADALSQIMAIEPAAGGADTFEEDVPVFFNYEPGITPADFDFSKLDFSVFSSSKKAKE